MRRHLLGWSVLLAGVGTLLAADKDTPLAANTRTKKLQTKITVDYQDQMLREAFADISKQLEDAGAGALSVKYDTGVSMNQRVTYKAANHTVADVLDGMLKRNNLGYVVISKDKDRYDGWLLIKQGNERGHTAGEEPKAGKAAAKAAPPAPKEKPPEKPAAGEDAERSEKVAASKLELARDLLRSGKTNKAKQRFQDIVQQFPDTKAAVEAKKELDKLGK
jgi:TolA-binding protein